MPTPMLLPVLALLAQAPEQPHFDQLARFPGAKVLLLGDWKASERTAWDRLVLEEGVFEAELRLVDRGQWSETFFGHKDPGGFEAWLRQRFGLGASRWVVVDGANRAVAFGIAVPQAAELADQLQKAGFEMPLRVLRRFVQSHPGHLEARADLLKTLRRRALKAVKPGAGDLDPEADTLAFAPLAQAVDVAFKGAWRGLELDFFQVDQVPAEHRSPLMKGVFARHLAAVEAALTEEPTSHRLWSLWAWMARSTGDRPWKKLVAGLDPFLFPGGPHCPAPPAATWLTQEAKATGDWEQVVAMASVGSTFQGRIDFERTSWAPGTLSKSGKYRGVPGWPESTYGPWIEALIRLNRVAEARFVAEDVRLAAGKKGEGLFRAAAKAAGRSDLAAQADPEPSQGRFWAPEKGIPMLVRRESGPPFRRFRVAFELEIGWKGLDPEQCAALGWPKGEERWALLDGKGVVAAQGENEPDPERIQEELTRLGFRSKGERAQARLLEHPADAHAAYARACALTAQANRALEGSTEGERLDPSRDVELWGEATRQWKAFYADDHGWRSARAKEGYFEGWRLAACRSPLMGGVAEAVLPRLEAALEAEPMSEFLWSQWLFWRDVDGAQRPFDALLARLEPSPTTPPGVFPPAAVMEAWLGECQRLGRWDQAAKLLRVPWERELAACDETRKAKPESKPRAGVWNAGRPLAEALIQAGKPSDAEAVVKAWTERGGALSGLDSLITLAKKQGLESLAKAWAELLPRPGR